MFAYNKFSLYLYHKKSNIFQNRNVLNIKTQIFKKLNFFYFKNYITIAQKMYNYFTSQKKKQFSEKILNQKIQNYLHNQYKQKNDNQLIRKYIIRSTHGHQKMLQANKQIKIYKDNPHEFRNFDKRKNIGTPNFYYRPRDDQSRIKQATKLNQSLDRVPFYLTSDHPSIHKFRSTKSKQNFKYTPFDSKSRVVQTVYMMKANQIIIQRDFNLRSYIKQKTHPKLKKLHSRSTSQKNLKQSILPNLNVKYYPKTLQSIKNQIQIGPLKNAIVGTKNNSNNLKLVKKSGLDVKYHTIHNGNDIQSTKREREL